MVNGQDYYGVRLATVNDTIRWPEDLADGWIITLWNNPARIGEFSQLACGFVKTLDDMSGVGR